MIEIRRLTELSSADLRRVGSGYSSDSRYVVVYAESEGCVSFELRLAPLDRPYVREWDYDERTLERYERVLAMGYSFGAYDGSLLVGLVVAEPEGWNRSLWVWEFHVAESYRKRGIGRRLMTCVAERAERAGLRTIVCETQNTNVTAINVYRKLGFRIEGIDISYYSNEDYPGSEIALFMKRRLP